MAKERPVCSAEACCNRVKKSSNLFCSRACFHAVERGAPRRAPAALPHADGVTCRLCGREMAAISNSHLRWTHGIEVSGYLTQFPGAQLWSESARAASADAHQRPRAKCSNGQCDQSAIRGHRFCSHACYVADRFHGDSDAARVRADKAAARARRDQAREQARHLARCQRAGCDALVKTAGRSYCSYSCASLVRMASLLASGRRPFAFKDGWSSTGQRQKHLARERDEYTCRKCCQNLSERKSEAHVHHLVPERCFDLPDEAHAIENLITLCRKCHMVVEWDMFRELYDRAVRLDALLADDPTHETLAVFKTRLVAPKVNTVSA